jgi:hypothetical protein
MRSPTSALFLRLVLTIVCLVGPATRAGLAQAADQPKAPDVYPLQLIADPAIRNGKVAAVEGTAGRSGQKLAVADLSVLQPVEVTLFAVDGTDDLRLDLSKFILDRPAKSISTKGAGFATARFRTQGDLQLTVTSPEGPRPYRLLVWAGNEATPQVPSLFAPIDAASPGSGGPPMMWVIAGLLVIIAGFLGVLVLKRGRS